MRPAQVFAWVMASFRANRIFTSPFALSVGAKRRSRRGTCASTSLAKQATLSANGLAAIGALYRAYRHNELLLSPAAHYSVDSLPTPELIMAKQKNNAM